MRRLHDKDQIVDLVHRYSYLVDHKQPDELMELFTEDCVVDYGPGLGPPVRGRAAFRGMFGANAGPLNSVPVLRSPATTMPMFWSTSTMTTEHRCGPRCTLGTARPLERPPGSGATTTT